MSTSSRRDNVAARTEGGEGYRVAFPFDPGVADRDPTPDVKNARATEARRRAIHGPKPDVLDLDWALAEHPYPDSRRALITPEVASRLLDLNTHNRKPRARNILDIARDMRLGEFEYSPHGIGISRDGVLVDGQQRLMACLESGATIDQHFFVGLPPKLFHKLDVGARRTAADGLYLQGVKNEGIVATTVKMLLNVQQWGNKVHYRWRSIPIRNWEVDAAYRRFGPEALQTAILVAYRARAHVRFSVGAGACAYYLFTQKGPVTAVEQFFNDFRLPGAGSTRDPVVVLRELFIQRERDGERNWDSYIQLAMMVNAWNARADSREVNNAGIRFNTSNPFPVVKAWPW